MSDRQYKQNFVSAQEYPAPPPPTTIYQTGGLGMVFITINCLFAAVMIVALARNANSAITAIVVGGLYFAPTTLAGLAILSGSWTQNRKYKEEQITIREANRLRYHRDTQRITVVDPLAIPRSPTVDTPQPEALPATSNYVPAVANQREVASDAVLWAMGLYIKETGEPNPDRVNLKGGTEPPGRLKRGGAPTDTEVKQFLLDRNVLLRINQGIALNLKDYPHMEDLRWLTR